jgi:hypothetical protein
VSGAVWLASYPRSGNTWTRLALKSLHMDGGDVELDEVSGFGGMLTGRYLIDYTLEADTGMLTESETLELRPDLHAAVCEGADPPLITKTHDAWIRTPAGRPLYDPAITHAAIYLLRDPRDVAVSWARFTGMSVDKSIAFLGNRAAALGLGQGSIGMQVSQPMGSWSDHVRSWIDDSGLDPLVVRYEDMLADPAAALTLMARRIGWDVKPEAIAGAVETTQFHRLADKEKRRGFRERSAKTVSFFHSGKAGTWRDVLEPDQAARIERDHRDVMERFGYL